MSKFRRNFHTKFLNLPIWANFVDPTDLSYLYYRVFHLKKLDSTLCLGDFLWHSEAVIGVKSSNRVGALTFRQEN